jgi:hypothetical protein
VKVAFVKARVLSKNGEDGKNNSNFNETTVNQNKLQTPIQSCFSGFFPTFGNIAFPVCFRVGETRDVMGLLEVHEQGDYGVKQHDITSAVTLSLLFLFYRVN